MLLHDLGGILPAPLRAKVAVTTIPVLQLDPLPSHLCLNNNAHRPPILVLLV